MSHSPPTPVPSPNTKNWTCRNCGAVHQRRPELQEILFDHPGGTTALGRRVKPSIKVLVAICVKCEKASVEAISLPLDTDAELIHQAFDLEGHTAEEQRQIYAYLREHNVTPADLRELARYKGKPLTQKVIDWFTKKGMRPPEIIKGKPPKIDKLPRRK